MDDCPACGGTTESDGKRGGHIWRKCIECDLVYPLCRYCYEPLKLVDDKPKTILGQKCQFVCSACGVMKGAKITYEIVDEEYWRVHYPPNGGLDIHCMSKSMGGSKSKHKNYDKPNDLTPKTPLDYEKGSQRQLMGWFGRNRNDIK